MPAERLKEITELVYLAMPNPLWRIRSMVHDLQAMILYCLGLNHERFTYRFQGRDYRLTDVSAADSPAKGAGKDGKDLGADVDLVGPGAAYGRWKMTPEYLEWLKESGRKISK